MLCACDTGTYKKLKAGAVPSIFAFHKGKATAPNFVKDSRRELQRKAVTLGFQEEVCTSVCSSGPSHAANEVDVDTRSSTINNQQPVLADDVSVLDSGTIMVDSVVQCTLLADSCGFSVKQFIHNAHAMKYFTGFDDYDHFSFFLCILGPAADCLNYKCSAMTTEDHLFMTLMKLRQAKDDVELGILFNVSTKVVAKVTQVWVNFMYFQLKELQIWPSQNVVKQHMPLSFGRLFGSTRVILDATECALEKPSHVALQSSTFSSYKNCNTVKTVVGCTPRGAVSLISDSYGGVQVIVK